MLVRIACVAVASWIFAGLAIVAAVHLDDRYRIGHASGTWMALAQRATEGTLYPPLYDGESYGGTRFMPLQVLGHAAVADVTGEFLVSGKLLALTAGVALLVLMLTALHNLGVPAWLGVALAALVVTTQTGLTAMTSIRGDTLPVVLQLSALLTIMRWSGRRAAVAAGLLCTAALLSKLSALWAPAAILVWLAMRDRQRLPGFLASLALSLGASLALLEGATDGRYSDNVLGLTFAALQEPGDLAAAVSTKPLGLIDADAGAIAIVVPLVLTDLVLSARSGRIVIEHLAFVGAAVVTLALMVDLGAVSNHLLDIEVLSVLLVGHLWVEHARRPHADAVVSVLVPLAVLWAATGAYVLDVHPDVKDAARAALGRPAAPYPVEPLGVLVGKNDRLLSEDPTIAVTSGHRPIVLDAFMLLRVLRDHPAWREDLVRRLDRGTFDRVVLLADHVEPDGSIDVSHPRWRREHFGPAVIEAIARNYRLKASTREYAVYAPADDCCSIREP